MSARGRRGQGVKVSFFAFQDIITCVSGILLIITLLMTTMITDDSGATEGGGEPNRAEDLTEAQQALEQAKSAVAALQAQVVAMTDPSTVRAQTVDLREKLPVARAKAEDLERKIAESGMDMATLTARVQQAAKELAELERKKNERTTDVDQLAQEVKEKEKRAANAANEWRLVPKLPSNSKVPVMVVVSDKGLTIEEFNKPGTRVKLEKAAMTSGFAAALQKFNPAVHYFVFYLKPSGIPDFATLKDIARGQHFDVGFDALLENVELTFSKPDA
jgi:hypothetical protein